MRRSILYLDDEVACLDIFQATFGGDYEVCTAITITEARLLLAERPFDIVISDQLTPEIEGSVFLSEVAEKYPASYRVMLTGSSHVGKVLPQISSGIIQFFIVKPWTEEGVRQILERTDATFNLRNRSPRE